MRERIIVKGRPGKKGRWSPAFQVSYWLMKNDSIGRIIDANINRVTEALRVAEDLCRFHWDFQGFARELKGLRHEVFEILFPPGSRREEILRYRDIEGDVGRDSPSPPRGSADPPSLAFSNLQRAKEALRTLEEACRIDRPEAAARLEKVRYHLYAVEKGLGHLSRGSSLRARLAEVRLYLLAGSSLTVRPLHEVVAEALSAGVGAVQLREKTLPDRKILLLARRLREETARAGALFLVNDRPDIALSSSADGVHLGQGDLPPAEARAIIGEEGIVGISTHSLEQARAAEREGADYIGFGPLYPTTTKGAGPVVGPSELTRILPEVSIPAFAIGGIRPENIGAVAAAGGRRAAISCAAFSAGDVGATVKALLAGLARGAS